MRLHFPTCRRSQTNVRRNGEKEKETFGGATDVELREYEERENRIDELCEKLRYLHPAA